MNIGKKIFVAGAGGLLGVATVEAILKDGGMVVAGDLNLGQMQDRLKASFSQYGDKLKLLEFDITDEANVISCFTSIKDLDGAVNCTYPRNKQYGDHFFDVSLASFNDNVSMHLGSAFTFMQQCAAYFKRTERTFSLVNVASIYGVVAPKFDIYKGTAMTVPVEYAAVKSSIIFLNQYVANYIADSRFRVNSVSPGGLFDSQPGTFLKAYKENTHGRGMLDRNDISGTILFLLSSHSGAITGQNIVVDDGFSL